MWPDWRSIEGLQFIVAYSARITLLGECGGLAYVRWTPLFGQKNGSIKVEPLSAILVRFSPKFLGLEDPLSWADLAACSAPTGEAEAGNAGEQPVKE